MSAVLHVALKQNCAEPGHASVGTASAAGFVGLAVCLLLVISPFRPEL